MRCLRRAEGDLLRIAMSPVPSQPSVPAQLSVLPDALQLVVDRLAYACAMSRPGQPGC